jgi:hypothetical protein
VMLFLYHLFNFSSAPFCCYITCSCWRY